MAEAEDVVTDLARHATVFAQDLWRRHRAAPARSAGSDLPRLETFARRLDLLIAAVFGTTYPIRIAQPPAAPTVMLRLFRSSGAPRLQQALPATDGSSIWLPASGAGIDHGTALARYRVVALQQAMRAQRGSSLQLVESTNPLLADLYLLVEAHASDQALIDELPGMATPIAQLRGAALASRPRLDSFAPHRRPIERLLRLILETGGKQLPACPPCESPSQSLATARILLGRITIEQRQEGDRANRSTSDDRPLLRDWWTGDLRAPASPAAQPGFAGATPDATDFSPEPRSVRMARRPDVRRPEPHEDDERPGAFMLQTAQPHEHAEDPAGLQRPTDRDEKTAAEDYAESVADLQQARLVFSRAKPREILMSDDAPGAQAQRGEAADRGQMLRLSYPEWDYRVRSYRAPGATVRLLQPALGSQQWVDRTLDQHRLLLDTIRHRFEMLRAIPQRLRKQVEGEEIDLESYVEGHADFHAGLPLTQGLYQTQRRARRSMAIMLLVDTSGSTDAWVAAGRRVIDVEREALLLVCIALERMGEPYSVQAFSGEGPQAVSVMPIKRFDETYGDPIARRIAGLEPEQYTRAGAAIRHATALLMDEPATHRLMLLLSDGRPNDVDLYEGRYGVEDTRQAVSEARLQGIFPFCLTVDRQGASYLPAVFGAGQYGLLPRPEMLPIVLLDWMKRLVSA